VTGSNDLALLKNDCGRRREGQDISGAKRRESITNFHDEGILAPHSESGYSLMSESLIRP